MADESSSSRNSESDADLAMKQLGPKLAEFHTLFNTAMQRGETGGASFELKFARGRLTGVGVRFFGEVDPRS